MSAFFLSINRDLSAFAPSQAQSMMAQIDRFGVDTKQLLIQDHYALGYQSLWVLPQEQGEQQPLHDRAKGDYLLFNGRIDNRQSIICSLGLLDHQISDASLMMAFYQRYKDKLEEHLKRIIGPFVFVVFNTNENQLVAARDAMGGRYLCYRITEQHIHIATFEMAIVGHQSVPYAVNKQKVGQSISVDNALRPSSAINGIEPLLPGHTLRFDNIELDAKFTTEVFYLPDPTKRIRLADDDAYAREFRRLFDQAVARRLVGVGKVACMLSGGLDSVPTAISAANLLAQDKQSLTALSWVFDKFPECDEREYSSEICHRFSIDQVCINCDEVWPGFNADMHISPLVPFGIPYSEFQQATLREAQQHKIKTVLTGVYGDHLYLHSDSIFIELLCAGRVAAFCQEFKRFWGAASSRRKLIKYYFIAQIPWVKKLLQWRRQGKKVHSQLLVEQLLPPARAQTHWLHQFSDRALRPDQYRAVLDASVGEDAAHGKYMDAKYGVERRYPFRDRELCEFMLAIPSDQLYFNLSQRPVMKRAFKDELGDKLLARNSKTSFLPVIEAGIARDQNSRDWFEHKPQNWNNYVKECYFTNKNAPKSMVSLVRWRCGFYSYWESVCYNSASSDTKLGKS